MAQRATESITVDASPQRVYDVVTDFEHYDAWVSDLKKIEVLSRDAEGRALEVEFRAAAFGRCRGTRRRAGTIGRLEAGEIGHPRPRRSSGGGQRSTYLG